MEIVLRRADMGDAGLLAELQRQAWRETYSGMLPQDILDAMTPARLIRAWRRTLAEQEGDKDRIILIAEVEEEPVGYLCGGKARALNAPWEAEVEQLYVIRIAQGEGVGSALMGEAARWFLTRALFSLGLWVVRANSKARRFYEAIGGDEVATARERMQGFLIPVAGYAWDQPEELAGLEAATTWRA
jgi:GNAT superfamily N-acetyltransferase